MPEQATPETETGTGRMDVKRIDPEIQKAIVDYAEASGVTVAVIVSRLWKLREYHREGKRHRVLEQHGLGQRIL